MQAIRSKQFGHFCANATLPSVALKSRINERIRGDIVNKLGTLSLVEFEPLMRTLPADLGNSFADFKDFKDETI
jgi:hypothetical protein